MGTAPAGMVISLSSRVVRNDEILSTDLDGVVVMLNPDKGTYLELDAVGTRIWNLLDGDRSVADVCDVLVAEYAVTSDVCRRDVLAFIERARELEIVGSGSSAARPVHDGGSD